MAILDVLTYPNPLLRKKATSVDTFDSSLEEFAKNMLETMYKMKGIGLAATQVGDLRRLIVIDTTPLSQPQTDEEGKRYEETPQTEREKKIEQPLVLVNPELLEKTGDTTYKEGCLSVPGYYEDVKRFNLIKIRYCDIHGSAKELETDGLLSICIQHEIDHLDGKLFIDRLSMIKANRVKNKIKKYGYEGSP